MTTANATQATTKRIGHKVYAMTHKGISYEIDGQNHEFDSKEWQLFVHTTNGLEWYETLPTKRDAILYVLSL